MQSITHFLSPVFTQTHFCGFWECMFVLWLSSRVETLYSRCRQISVSKTSPSPNKM